METGSVEGEGATNDSRHGCGCIGTVSEERGVEVSEVAFGEDGTDQVIEPVGHPEIDGHVAEITDEALLGDEDGE